MSTRHINVLESEKHDPKGFPSSPTFGFATKDENGNSTYQEPNTLPSCLAFVDGNAVPPTTNNGDIYILINEGNGAVNTDWNGASYNDFVRFSSGIWVSFNPFNGVTIYNKADDLYYLYNSGWSVFVPDVPTLYTQNGSIPTTTNREVTIPADSSLDLLGRVGIGKTPNTSAILDASVSNKGLRLPQGDEADMTGISTPADWMLFQRNDLNGAIWMYNPDALDWVPLSVGYGIIEVIRDSDNGVPTYFADLQTALETCKSGTNTVILHSNITITSTINIKQGGTGTGNAYNYDNLTIDFNGFTLTNNEADTSSCFDVYMGGSSSVYRRIKFKNGVVNRTSGTGTHYALFSDYNTHYGHLEMSGMLWYCENGIAGQIELELPTSNNVIGIADFGGSSFYSENSKALDLRDYKVQNFSVANNTSSVTINIATGVTAKNFNVINDSTGAGLAVGADAEVSFFNIKTTTGIGLDVGDDFQGLCSNFTIQTTTGDGIDTTGTSSTYKLRFSNFEIRCENGICIDSNHRNTFFDNFLVSNNGTSYTISEVNDGIRNYSNGTAINYGSGEVIQVFNVNNVNFNGVTFVSFGDSVGTLSLDNVSHNVSFNGCNFESKFNDANGHGLIISNSTGDIIIDQSTFKLTNTSANCIYASASRTIKASNNTMIGATTPINANITVTASTDLGNGNRQL